MRYIGIDLGTTNSVVSTIENGRPKVLANEDGESIIPSAVGLDDEGNIIVGSVAKHNKIKNPDNTVLSVKSLMGTDKKIVLNGKKYTPVEISAMILKHLKEVAEENLGSEIEEAVITVPAHFNDSQRKATIESAELAGLKVLRIINEPTSACLAYGLGQDKENKVMIYDLGGGTFDVSIVDIDGTTFEVLSSTGDTHLGGDDFDNLLVDYIINQIKETSGETTPKSLRPALKEVCESLKKQLATEDMATTVIPKEFYNRSLEVAITLESYNKLIEPLVAKTIEHCHRALVDAEMTINEIDEIVLVGGSCRNRLVSEMLEDTFDIKPDTSINPDECVSVGACVQAGIIKKELKDYLLMDVTPLSLGVITTGDLFSPIVERNTKIPCVKTSTYTTTSDYAQNIKLKVVQGENLIGCKNTLLGEYELNGIQKAPRGVPKIEVKFYIDANGNIKVTATDMLTSSKLDVSINNMFDKVNSNTVREEVKKSTNNESERKELTKRQRLKMEVGDLKELLLKESISQEQQQLLQEITEIDDSFAKLTIKVIEARKDEVYKGYKSLISSNEGFDLFEI